MKPGILATLLFMAAASLLVEVNADEELMCPHDYLKKHPEKFHMIMKKLKEKGSSVDFSKLPSCSENQKCAEDRLCCKSPCGMKCMRPVTEKNADEIIYQIHKEIEVKEPTEPYVETEADKKLGMCPRDYLRAHPDFKEKMHNAWKNKEHKHHHDGQCKGGKECPMKGKHGMPFQHLSSKADCSVDGDCQDQMRCCQTMCGMKCMKPVFTEEDYKKSVFGDRMNDRPKRDLEQQGDKADNVPEEEHDHDKGTCALGEHNSGHEEKTEEGDEHGKGHGKGGEHGKGAKRGKGKNKGKGKGRGKGAENGKGHGKGLEHGKGAKHGKGHGKGLEHGKGAKHGKGHGKGLEHGKGAKNGKGHGKELENEESQENEGQVEEVAEHLREKRFAPNLDNDNGHGQEPDSTPGKRERRKKGKGKQKGKGKNNKNKQCKGKGKGKIEGHEN